MAPQVAPYGTWNSPVTVERLVEAVVRLNHLQISGGDLYWVESRPSEGGRDVIVLRRGEQDPTAVIGPEFNARTRVHEYGGRCYAVDGERVLFSNWSDQRLWIQDGSSPARPLTPEPDRPASLRYADPVFAEGGGTVVCVRESHREDGTVVNELVAVPVGANPEGVVGAAVGRGASAGEPDAAEPPKVLAAGSDFYAAPRVSPDGTRLAWLSWDLPDMPWDSTVLWAADLAEDRTLGEAVRIAGGPGESITQPRWSPAGVLHYVSDRTGWWNIYSEKGEPLCAMDAEFGRPDWVFGATTYGFLDDDTVIAVWGSGGMEHLGLIQDGRARELPLSFSYYTSLVAQDGMVAAIASAPDTPSSVVVLDPLRQAVDVVQRSQEPFLDTPMVSVPRAERYPTGDGQTAHLLFYPPRNSGYVAAEGERPPVLVLIHGGPTSQAVPAFDRGVQYWTSRGFAVADINYRGSSGFGREYRNLLTAQWGLSDVEDCARAIEWLDGGGLVDGTRALIRGGSAGGFTTLAALAFTRKFAAGASLYGVADLELLARDTHKFESRYLDSLVGPWPEASQEYRRRSPIHHIEQIASPLIMFQGSEDRVVPPEQSRLMYNALRDRGIAVEYHEFEGEQHGFRNAETVKVVAREELAFYLRVLKL